METQEITRNLYEPMENVDFSNPLDIMMLVLQDMYANGGMSVDLPPDHVPSETLVGC